MKKDKVLQLYDLYADNVYKLAYSYTGSAADAEDIVQDVFLKLLQKNISVTAGKEKAYLMQVAANACRDHLRSASVRKNVTYEEYLANENNNQDLEDSELLHALSQLPFKYRTVIHLHYYEGYTLKEISKILKLSVSAVSMRLTRGREMLKELMKED